MRIYELLTFVAFLGFSVSSHAFDLVCKGTYEDSRGEKELELIYVLDSEAQSFLPSGKSREQLGIPTWILFPLLDRYLTLAQFTASKVEVSVISRENAFIASKLTLDRRSGKLVQKWFKNTENGSQERPISFSAMCDKAENVEMSNKF